MTGVKPRRTCTIGTAPHKAMEPPRGAQLKGIVYQDEKKIAAPMLQDKIGGNKRVPQFFEARFWISVAPEGAKPVMLNLTENEWRKLGKRWNDEWRSEQEKKNDDLRAKSSKSHFSNNPFASALRGTRV
jgi:hypothetical protein